MTAFWGDESPIARSAIALNRLYTDVRDFGAVGNGSTDDTAAIQAAINSAVTTTAACFIPASTQPYMVSQITIPRPLTLFGATSYSGSFSSKLKQIPGSNLSLIVPDPAITSNDWMHSTIIRDMYLLGDKVNCTLGCGIDMTRRTGENSLITNIICSSFPESGIRLTRGSTPGSIVNCASFNNGEYGFDLKRTASDIWHQFYVNKVSGDNNGTALIHIHTMGSAHDQIVIDGVKSETSVVGKQQDVIVLENLNSCPIRIDNIACLGSVSMNSVVKILGGGAANVARIICRNWRDSTGITKWIDDLQNAKTYNRASAATTGCLVEGFWNGAATTPGNYLKQTPDYA